jgi:hypothetical protein
MTSILSKAGSNLRNIFYILVGTTAKVSANEV